VKAKPVKVGIVGLGRWDLAKLRELMACPLENGETKSL
jgi:hypothetical protein